MHDQLIAQTTAYNQKVCFHWLVMTVLMFPQADEAIGYFSKFYSKVQDTNNTYNNGASYVIHYSSVRYKNPLLCDK